MAVRCVRKLDHSKDWVEWVKIGFGFTLYILWNRDQPMPLGFVWGVTATEKRFEVCGSYVPKFARRQGVRTALNRAILRDYKIISTPGGTKEGCAFMRAQGYRFFREMDAWFLFAQK